MDFEALYAQFDLPLASLDCGERCAPYNERGIPFCCDARHAVPVAYPGEWEFLSAHTDLWRLWQAEKMEETAALQRQVPQGHKLIVCQGHTFCQRNYRSVICRAFPFFPYLTRQGEFIGLAYYWEYADRCWVISHLAAVTLEYRAQFEITFEALFAIFPEERENFRQYSITMRRVFGRQGRAIPLLHHNGGLYKVTPRNGRLRRVAPDKLSKHGPYKIAALLPFPEERE